MARVWWIAPLVLAACTKKPPSGPDGHSSVDKQMKQLADLVIDEIRRGDATKLQAIVPTRTDQQLYCPDVHIDDARLQHWHDALPKAIESCRDLHADAGDPSAPGWDAPRPNEECDALSTTTMTMTVGELTITVDVAILAGRVLPYALDCGHMTGD